MAVIRWLKAMSGGFDNAADWKGGAVPGASDDAIIAAHPDIDGGYIVIVSQDTTVHSLTTMNPRHGFVTEVDIMSTTFKANSVANGCELILADSTALSVKGKIFNSFFISSQYGFSIINAKDLVNEGSISAGNSSVLTINSPVTGRDGTAQITQGSTLKFTSSFNQDVLFSGSGELDLADSELYSKSVTGFSNAGQTSLDLGDIGFVASGEATYSGTKKKGVLTVTDGAHTASIHLVGDYLSATFTASADGDGGTMVVANTEAPVTSSHALISAMASLGAPPAQPTHTGETWFAPALLLSGPRAAAA